MSQKSVSVIIPAYNEADFIEPTLQSVLDQKHSDLELIVVPNGCTDNTAEIASRYTPKVFDTNERGIGRAKNIGFEKATGEIIAFLDADSQMMQGLIKNIIEALEGKYIGGKSRIFPSNPTLGAKLYFGYDNFCGHLSQLLTYFNPSLNNGAGANIFSSHDLLDFLKRRDGHVFREDIQTMEDVNFIGRLRAEGPFKYISKNGVITSTRRFDKDGYLKRFVMDFVEFINPEAVEERKDVR